MAAERNKSPITVVILTYNEEKNIRAALESVRDWAAEIFIVDSGSTDGTLDIVNEYTANVYHHKFENYSSQRNWALENLPIGTDWVFNLDADHRVTPELRSEVRDLFAVGVAEDVGGFLTSRKTVFMGRWIKHGGHYPVYHCALFRRGWGRCEQRLYDQHFVVRGRLIRLKGDVADIVTQSLTSFTNRHNLWSTLEANEFLRRDRPRDGTIIEPRVSGNSIERRRWLRQRFYGLPLFLRSLLFFFYRYFFRLGFLDGKEGLVFHFLQGFWFRFLVDAKIFEMRKSEHNDANSSSE